MPRAGEPERRDERTERVAQLTVTTSVFRRGETREREL
jgi:hypothetical protein